MNRLATLLVACVLALGTAAFGKDEPKKVAPMPVEEKQSAKVIDINSASAKELMELKGVGEARAADIIKGRPYKGRDELLEKKIVPESVYAEIKNQIIAKQSGTAPVKKDAKK
jgi:competence protein ComEA